MTLVNKELYSQHMKYKTQYTLNTFYFYNNPFIILLLLLLSTLTHMKFIQDSTHLKKVYSYNNPNKNLVLFNILNNFLSIQSHLIWITKMFLT